MNLHVFSGNMREVVESDKTPRQAAIIAVKRGNYTQLSTLITVSTIDSKCIHRTDQNFDAETILVEAGFDITNENFDRN